MEGGDVNEGETGGAGADSDVTPPPLDATPTDGNTTIEAEEEEEAEKVEGDNGGGGANNTRKIRSPISLFITPSIFDPASVRVTPEGVDSGQGLGVFGAPNGPNAPPTAVGKSLMMVRSRCIS